jgi:tripartite-type tricarboxylate transporter receptor subunit TctC
MTSNVSLLPAVAILCMPALADIAAGQEFSRPLTILVPFSAGGSSDQGARLIAGKVADSLGQAVIVDNRTGGNGQVAAAVAKQARPDGHTLLWASHGILAINPSLYSKLSYDAIKDFEPVTLVFKSTHFLLVPTNSTAKSAAEVVALARAKPGQLSFASVGVGSGSHLVGEMFRVTHKMQSPDLVARMAEFGAEVIPSESPQEFAAFIASETARLGKLVKDSGARLD